MLKAPALRCRPRPGHLVWLLVPLMIGWAAQTAPLAHLRETLSGLGWVQVSSLLGLNVLVVLSFSGRWWAILRGLGQRVPYFRLSAYRLAAFGISYFTPGPQFGGEPLQAYALRKRHGVPGATATASVALDKLLEVTVNLAVLVAGIGLTLHQQVWGRQMGAGALAAALILLALPISFFLALGAGRQPATWLAQRSPAWLQEMTLYRRFRDFVIVSETEAAQFCRRKPLRVLQALAFSLLSWGLLSSELWLAVRFLGPSLTWLQLVAILTAARIAFLLPLPGGLGTLEASQVLAFQAIGLDPATGLSLSLVIRVRDALFGGAGLWWGSLLISKRDTCE